MGPPAPSATTLPAPILQPLPCHESSLPQLPISAPPASLDECFFLNSLVVGLPYSSIFCRFKLFLNLLLSFFWLCGKAECIHLCLHLGRKSHAFDYWLRKFPKLSYFLFLSSYIKQASHFKLGVLFILCLSCLHFPFILSISFLSIQHTPLHYEIGNFILPETFKI